MDISVEFPFGVKTSYRAYASDAVVEFKIEEPSTCATPIGRLTGLEPFTLFSRWYPQPNPSKGRNCEGMYLLTRIPVTKLQHADFVNFEDFYASIVKTNRGVMAR